MKNMFQGLLLLLVTVMLCGCNEQGQKTVPWNQFSVTNDLSYPMWYLSKVLGVTDYGTWNVYELESTGMKIALFQDNTAEPAGSGSYYLFGYDQIGDNPLAYACILEGNAVLVDTYSDSLSLYKLIFTAKWDKDDSLRTYFGEDDLYVLCDKNGKIKRFMGESQGFMSYEFAYNDAGQIETLYYADGNTNWGTLSSFISEPLDFEQCARLTYNYNKDGTLKNVYTCNYHVMDDADNLTLEFEYDESGQRKKTIDCFQYSCDYVEFYQQKKGLTTEKIVYDGNGDITSYRIEYLNDGTFNVY